MNTVLKVQLAMAHAHYREGRFGDAEQIYLQLYDLDRENTGVLTRLGEIALWKNQTAAAERYFTMALQSASWLAKQWPLSAQLNTALAMTHYRQDRFPQAAQRFLKAAGPVAIGPFRDLKAMGTQLEHFNEQTPYLIEGPKTAHIPFMLTDPLPVLQVSINGSEPAPFFIDTGDAEVIVDRAFASHVGAIRAGMLSGEGGGTKGAIGLGKVDAIQIGDINIKHVPIHIMDTQPFAAVFAGLSVKGVIGTRLLMHFLATIDYVNARLILRRATSAAQIETPTANGGQKTTSNDLQFTIAHNHLKSFLFLHKLIPFWLIQTHYMVVYGTLNEGAPMLFFVDTGLAGKGFSAPEATLREAGINVDWAKAETAIAAFGASETVDIVADRLTLGIDSNEVVAQHVPGVAFKKPTAIPKLGFHIGGMVSHQFFRNYALTLDFVGMKLILQGQ
jgi:predicted aspartyl protease